MPVFEAMPYLESAVGSVVGQTFGDWELIAVDDGSGDGSWACLQSWAQRDTRVRPIRADHGGIVSALNRALAETRGQLIARMDADDVSRPTRLAEQVAYLDAHPEVAAVGTDLLRIDPAGRPIGEKGVSTQHAQIESVMLAGQAGAMTHATTMTRRAALEAVSGGTLGRPALDPAAAEPRRAERGDEGEMEAGNEAGNEGGGEGGVYREWARHAEDLELFLRVAEWGRLANLDRVLYEVRQHTTSITHTEDERRLRALKARIVAEASARRGLAVADPRVPDAIGTGGAGRRLTTLDHRLLWASRALGSGHAGTARRHAAVVATRRPWSARAWVVLLGSCLPARLRTALRDQRRRRLAGREAATSAGLRGAAAGTGRP